mmetsp:Transcript_24861/g.63322  ORF Transcript_24861/g.63322 Transcript_24861/m.63322 type:complete len:214 (+) Transcript_24861:335-976(+)
MKRHRLVREHEHGGTAYRKDSELPLKESQDDRLVIVFTFVAEHCVVFQQLPFDNPWRWERMELNEHEGCLPRIQKIIELRSGSDTRGGTTMQLHSKEVGFANTWSIVLQENPLRTCLESLKKRSQKRRPNFLVRIHEGKQIKSPEPCAGEDGQLKKAGRLQSLELCQPKDGVTTRVLKHNGRRVQLVQLCIQSHRRLIVECSDQMASKVFEAT